MRAWVRALIVPLIAMGLWLVPSDRPNTEVAGAVEVASLADAAPTPATSSLVDAQPEATEAVSTVSPPTTLAAVTSTAAAAETTVLDTTTAVVTPPTVAATTPDSGSGNSLTIDTSAAVPPTTDTPTTATPTTATPTTVAPTTVAPTTVAPTTTLSSLTLGEQALQRVSFDWRAAFPTWDVQFLGPRNGIRALTYPGERRIEIFVRSSDTAATLHRVFAHELGHVIDVERNSDGDRARWLEQRGLSGSTRWWPNAEAPDFATGAGDFAEAFAVWETGVTTRSTLAGQPTRADLDLLRELSQG